MKDKYNNISIFLIELDKGKPKTKIVLIKGYIANIEDNFK